jgi:hypothetical protein
MSELSPITAAQDREGLFRTFEDEATGIKTELILGFDELENMEEEEGNLYGLEVRVFMQDAVFARRRFTDPDRSRLIGIISSEEEIKQCIFVAVLEATKKRPSLPD